jgi:hypothetical protein
VSHDSGKNEERKYQPFGILKGSCVFRQAVPVEVQMRWDNLLKSGLLPHLLTYEWNKEKCCLEQIKAA